jgi:rubredoxin-NAD+ reductase
VVCPPAANAQGEWQVTADDEQIVARFVAGDQLLGFALQGKAVAQRQALAQQVPAVLA